MNILIRQVIDIQNQIKNHNRDLEVENLNALLECNNQIKMDLLENIKDDFILEQVEKIPNFKLEDFKIGFDFIGFFVSIFSGRFDSYNDKKYDFEKAKEALNEINNKYASLEQMLKY